MNISKRISRCSFLALFVLFSLSSRALPSDNDSTKRHFEVSLIGGVWNLASIDEMYSFQKFHGNHLFGGLSLGIINEKSRHLISFQYSEIKRKCDHLIYSDGLLEQRYHAMNSMMLDIDYSYLRRIRAGDLTLFATISWMNSFNYTVNEDDPEVFLSSVAPGIALQYKLKKHVFWFDCSVPVISLAIRDPYYASEAQTDEGYDELEYLMDNLRLESFGDLTVLNAKLHYQYPLSRRIAVDARYQFRYINYQEPRPLRSVSGLYSAGFTIIF